MEKSTSGIRTSSQHPACHIFWYMLMTLPYQSPTVWAWAYRGMTLSLQMNRPLCLQTLHLICGSSGTCIFLTPSRTMNSLRWSMTVSSSTICGKAIIKCWSQSPPRKNGGRKFKSTLMDWTSLRFSALMRKPWRKHGEDNGKSLAAARGGTWRWTLQTLAGASGSCPRSPLMRTTAPERVNSPYLRSVSPTIHWPQGPHICQRE